MIFMSDAVRMKIIGESHIVFSNLAFSISPLINNNHQYQFSASSNPSVACMSV